MDSASSQARKMEQFVCGTPLRERQRQVHLPDTRLRSRLWVSRQMASASSQARPIEQFVCGTRLWERQRQAHLLDAWIRSRLGHSRQMVSVFSRRDMCLFVC